MTDEKTVALKAQFPKVFEHAEEPFLSEGFRCNDGWFMLIQDTFSKIEDVLNRKETEFVLKQVKEKFGELTIYAQCDSCTDRFIQSAWAKSLTTCEVCGLEGRIRPLKWYIKCTCDSCAERIETEEDS